MPADLRSTGPAPAAPPTAGLGPSAGPTIRRATPADLDAVTALEAACFPPSEAAPRSSIAARLALWPDRFWLALDDDGAPVACVNGLCSSERDLRDEMFADASLHEPDGPWQMLFGVLTRPDHQHRGLAGALLRRAIADCREEGRAGLVLTCKEHLLAWYGSFGFVGEGVSTSEHGGAVWHQMRLAL